MRPSDFIRKITTEWQMLLRSLRPSRATTRTRPSASSQPPSEPLLSGHNLIPPRYRLWTDEQAAALASPEMPTFEAPRGPVQFEWAKYANQPFQTVDGSDGRRNQLGFYGVETLHLTRPRVYDWATEGMSLAEVRSVPMISPAVSSPVVPGKSWRDELCGWPYVDPEVHAKLNEGGC